MKMVFWTGQTAQESSKGVHMCGMCGIADTSYLLEQDKSLFVKLMYVNVFRGFDATGLIKVNKNFSFDAIKDVSPAYEFLFEKSAQDFLSEKDKHSNKRQFRALFGHTRQGTKGSNSIENAHPFEYETFIGCHNGTIDWPQLGKDDSDSRTLFDKIESSPKARFADKIEDALKQTESINAAYALQIYNKKEKSFYFVRNGDRPLHFTYLAGYNTMLWSSSRTDLEYILISSSRTYKAIGNKEFQNDIIIKDKVFELKPNMLFKVNLDKWTINFEKLNITKKYYPTVRYNRGWVETSYSGTNHNTSTATASSTNKYSAYNYFINNKQGVFVYGEEARELKEEGCSICRSKTFKCNINFPVTWLPDGTYICSECMESDWAKEYAESIKAENTTTTEDQKTLGL